MTAGDSRAAEVASPCISVCALDDAGVCTGCWRHVDEIAAWRGLDGEQRREVLRRSAQRRRDALGSL
jgi:predicted Fe-S protein YdhL (DUF1289 family)